MELRTLDELSNALSPRARALITQIMQRDCACQLLDLFHQRPRTWLQVEDIAYYLRCPLTQTDQVLSWLADTQVVQSHSVSGLTFYSLTEDSELVGALEQFWSWRENWFSHLDRVRQNLFQHTTRHALATWTRG